MARTERRRHRSSGDLGDPTPGDSANYMPAPRDSSNLKRYEDLLKIDRDGLDDAVIDQPEFYYHVSREAVLAAARRDEMKLNYQEAEAEAGRILRDTAAEKEEKITEASLKEALKLDTGLQKMQRRLLEVDTEVARWAALRDAFRDRSYMLRELVAMHLARLTPASYSTKDELADVRRAQIDEKRAATDYGARRRR